MSEKLKSILSNDKLFFSFLVVLVAVFSFGLGRYSGVIEWTQSGTERVRVFESRPTSKVDTDLRTASQNNSLVLIASRSGTKYHRSDCPGAAQIKPDNIITFSSATAARAAGYTPAANCPGLE
jgi:hypothetical protein